MNADGGDGEKMGIMTTVKALLSCVSFLQHNSKGAQRCTEGQEVEWTLPCGVNHWAD